MGCGPAYYSGYALGSGAILTPFYFGTRPNPVRPAVVPPTYTPENIKRRYPPYVYDEPIRSTDTQFWRHVGDGGGSPLSNLPPYERCLDRRTWQQRRVLQNARVVAGIDTHAQRWSNGNLLSGRAYLYPVRR